MSLLNSLMKRFKKKPHCLGDYNWDINCNSCEYLGRCLDLTDTLKGGRRYVLTDEKPPNVTPRQR